MGRTDWGRGGSGGTVLCPPRKWSVAYASLCVCLPSPGKDQNASAHIQRDNLREGPALWCPARAVLCVGRRQKAAAADNGASKACPMIWYDTVPSKYVFPRPLSIVKMNQVVG